jgi:hypothetical protein
VLVASCERTPAPARQRDAGSVAARDAAITLPDAAARKLFVTGSSRCGECHEKMFGEWEHSAHANAASSPLYKLAVTAANDRSCDRCHAPLRMIAGAEITAGEGVTCDVCHTLREPAPSTTGAGFRLAVDDMVKYGPRCDLVDHYFHRMGCSKEHRESALCGTCHWWEPAGIPVFTEYAEWRAGPHATQGTQCQDCHMPISRAVVAVGSPIRNDVAHHGLLGAKSELRQRALGMDVTLAREATGLVATVTVRNVGAGHAVPTGLPERRLVVSGRLRDRSGKEVAVERQSLGRVLVNADGHEVPFWRATRVGKDTRIAPGGSQVVRLTLPELATGTLEVEVVHRAMPDEIAAALGATKIEEYPMAAAKLAFGATLPRTTTVKPPAIAKRPPQAVRKATK